MRLAILWFLACTVAGTAAAQGGVPPKPPKMIDFATFSAEPIDPLWSQGMEARILEELAQITGVELLGLQVQCRTNLCRVQLTTRVATQTDTGSSPVFSILSEPAAKLGLVWQQTSTSPVEAYTETSIAYFRRADTAWTQTSSR